MKHDFSNLNTGTKKKAKSSNWIDPVDEEMEGYRNSYEDVTEAHNTYFNRLVSFNETLGDADSFCSDQEDRFKVIKLMDDVMYEDITSRDKSKPWKALLDLVEDDYADKLMKEHKVLQYNFMEFKSDVDRSIKVAEDLRKKIS